MSVNNKRYYCPNCQIYYSEKSSFCAECGTKLETIEEKPPATGQQSSQQAQTNHLAQHWQRSYHQMEDKRPLGFTILCIIIGLGILGNINDIGVYSKIFFPLAIYNIIMIILQIAVIYGLWEQKIWGYKLTLTLFGLDILMAALTGFIMPDFFISLMTNNSSFPIHESIRDIMRGTLAMTSIIVIIISIIIILYVNSRKELFVND